MSGRSGNSIASSRPGMPLSPRQREVIRLHNQRWPNKLIARALGVEVTTVRKHLTAAHIRLGATTDKATV
jgi:DNA-binding NarL/FixJ family response regulator